MKHGTPKEVPDFMIRAHITLESVECAGVKSDVELPRPSPRGGVAYEGGEEGDVGGEDVLGVPAPQGSRKMRECGSLNVGHVQL